MTNEIKGLSYGREGSYEGSAFSETPRNVVSDVPLFNSVLCCVLSTCAAPFS
jgi:hypothetical protein